MIDEGMRYRRRVLGWVLIALAILMLVLLVIPGRMMVEQMMLGTVSDSYALLTGVVLILLALMGTGAYLLRTVSGR